MDDSLQQRSPNFSARGPLLPSKITTDSYILANLNIECPDDKYKN